MPNNPTQAHLHCEEAELTLQDVLIACENLKGTISVGSNGGITVYEDRTMYPQNPPYDLTKDYSGQSEDFYVFLYQLLCSDE